MILYVLEVLPIMKSLKHYVEDIEGIRRWNTLQVWYNDEPAMDFYLYRIKYWLTKLSRIEPSFGYHSDMASILLVTSEANLYLATTFFSEKVFKIKTVLCYLDR